MFFKCRAGSFASVSVTQKNSSFITYRLEYFNCQSSLNKPLLDIERCNENTSKEQKETAYLNPKLNLKSSPHIQGIEQSGPFIS